MSKTYEGRKGFRELERDAYVGMKVYYINEHAGLSGGFLAERTYSVLTATHQGGLFATTWLWAEGSEHYGKLYGKGSRSTKDITSWEGGVSAAPPHGLRELASPSPDCRDEGYGPPRSWATETRRFDETELRGLEKLARQADEQADVDHKAGRRPQDRTPGRC